MFAREKWKLVKLPTSKILPNPAQPRKIFQEDELRSLAQSIEENGLLQPVTVRRENGQFYLVAGERRLRACKMAGIKDIPAIISDCEAEDSAVLALLENLQRRDLEIFEQANAIQNLIHEWQITQEEAARRLGMSQSALANKLRLLKLSPDEQAEIIAHKLSERHARALLRLDDIEVRQRVLQEVILKGLNVADTEKKVADSLQKKQPAKRRARRTFVAKDIRIFINTFDHAVETMKDAGIAAEAKRNETEEYIECVVRIPKLSRVQV